MTNPDHSPAAQSRRLAEMIDDSLRTIPGLGEGPTISASFPYTDTENDMLRGAVHRGTPIDIELSWRRHVTARVDDLIYDRDENGAIVCTVRGEALSIHKRPLLRAVLRLIWRRTRRRGLGWGYAEA
jgi:hypothetical protein